MRRLQYSVLQMLPSCRLATRGRHLTNRWSIHYPVQYAGSRCEWKHSAVVRFPVRQLQPTQPLSKRTVRWGASWVRWIGCVGSRVRMEWNGTRLKFRA